MYLMKKINFYISNTLMALSTLASLANSANANQENFSGYVNFLPKQFTKNNNEKIEKNNTNDTSIKIEKVVEKQTKGSVFGDEDKDHSKYIFFSKHSKETKNDNKVNKEESSEKVSRRVKIASEWASFIYHATGVCCTVGLTAFCIHELLKSKEPIYPSNENFLTYEFKNKYGEIELLDCNYDVLSKFSDDLSFELYRHTLGSFNNDMCFYIPPIKIKSLEELNERRKNVIKISDGEWARIYGDYFKYHELSKGCLKKSVFKNKSEFLVEK